MRIWLCTIRMLWQVDETRYISTRPESVANMWFESIRPWANYVDPGFFPQASETPFTIHVGGLVKMPDHWLFLTANQGNDKLIQLYDDSYDFDKEAYESAFKQTGEAEFSFESLVDQLELITISDDILEWMRGERETWPTTARVERRIVFNL